LTWLVIRTGHVVTELVGYAHGAGPEKEHDFERANVRDGKISRRKPNNRKLRVEG
jgi:hypothetical protein